jgi:hypothetical protein
MTEQLKKELKKLCYDVENFFGFLTLWMEHQAEGLETEKTEVL